MTNEQELIAKLRRIESLFAGTDYQGERDAAANAMARLKERLAELQHSDPPVEYRFTLQDLWSRRVLVALLRRYDLKPYRYRGQRHTTVMARVPVSFVNDTLWPEFEKIDETLTSYLDDVTDRVVRECIHHDATDAEVKDQKAIT